MASLPPPSSSAPVGRPTLGPRSGRGNRSGAVRAEPDGTSRRSGAGSPSTSRNEDGERGDPAPADGGRRLRGRVPLTGAGARSGPGLPGNDHVDDHLSQVVVLGPPWNAVVARRCS